MTVEDLIAALLNLPKEARQKPVVYNSEFDDEADVDEVDYNLSRVLLR